MKKFLLAAAAAFLLAAPSQAEVKFGLRGGLNINNFSMSSSDVESSNRTGFYVGPTIKIGLPIIDLDAAVLYDQRDLKVDEETVSKKNIDLQVNVRKGFGLGDNASIFIFAGPQFGFNIGAKNETISSQVTNWRWKDSDFSINVGIGAMVLNHLEAKVNYNIACGKSADASVTNAATSAIKDVISPKSNAWQIGLAYYF